MKHYVLLIVVAAFLHGCAFTTEVVDIPYSPQPGLYAISNANEISVSVMVTDSRLDRSRVSSKKNGYGMETAPILAKRDVPTIISDAVRQELATRGFKVGKAEPSVLVKADVRRFYNDHKLGIFAGDAVADFEFTVEVFSANGAELYSRGIFAQGKEANTQLATGNNAALALGKALSSGVGQLFADQNFIGALMSGRVNHPLTAKGSKEELLDELAKDKSISYEEYLRRQKLIMRE